MIIQIIFGQRFLSGSSRYTEVGKVWMGLKWLRRGTSGALLCDLDVPLNAVNLLAS